MTFQLSIDRDLDAELDSQVGSCWIDELEEGTQVGCSVSQAMIPEKLPLGGEGGKGPFYWITCADSIGGVDEGDEANNCLVSICHTSPRHDAIPCFGRRFPLVRATI